MSTKKTTDSSQEVFTSEPRVYELGYLIAPTVDEGDLQEKRDALVATITNAKGIVIDESLPLLIDLAYSMDVMIKNKKHIYDQGYFGWIKFDVAPHEIEGLQKAVEEHKELIRFILIKTVRENTLTSEQPFKLARGAQHMDDTEDEYEDEEHEDDLEEDTDSQTDDLTKIEGIGPVIAKTLNEADVVSFSDLADAGDEQLQDIISDVRGSHDAGTWNEQASLARDGKWDELDTLQDNLKGGKEA